MLDMCTCVCNIIIMCMVHLLVIVLMNSMLVMWLIVEQPHYCDCVFPPQVGPASPLPLSYS